MEENKVVNQEGTVAEPAKIEEKRETLTLPVKEEPKEQDLMFDKPLEDMSKEEIVEAAKKWGHRPKEAHRGDPDKWQDPETFLKNSRAHAPAHANQIKKLNQMVETQNKLLANQQKQNEELKASLQPKMVEALDNADHKEYVRLQKQEQDLDRQSEEFDKQILQPEQESDVNQALKEKCAEWERNNPEYRTNDKVREVADKAFKFFTNKYPDAAPERILDAVTIEVNNIKSSSSLQSTSTQPSNMQPKTKTKSYDNLTEGAKKVCDNYGRSGGDKKVYISNSDDSCFIWSK